jgi:hypothetical protein
MMAIEDEEGVIIGRETYLDFINIITEKMS